MFVLYYFFFTFLGPHPWHMEVLKIGVKLELQLPAYATATARPNLSRICDLHHTSQQCWILNPLNKARDRTRNLMVPSQINFHFTMMGTPFFCRGVGYFLGPHLQHMEEVPRLGV